MLSLYREALQIRRGEPALGDGTLRWLDAPDGVLAFARGERFACVLNLSAEPVELPPHDRSCSRAAASKTGFFRLIRPSGSPVSPREPVRFGQKS